MPSLADIQDLIGFFSYSREDDQDSTGELSNLREEIQRQLRSLLGRTSSDFRLWQDKTAIAAGARWQAEITRAISQAMFFIPIVTPTTIRSQYCRFEFKAFLTREKILGRENLIFPILYINVPALTSANRSSTDAMLTVIAERQYTNWTRFRHEGVDRKAMERFCQDVVAALSLEYQTITASQPELPPPPVTVTVMSEEQSARDVEERRGPPPAFSAVPDLARGLPGTPRFPRLPGITHIFLVSALGLGGALALAGVYTGPFLPSVPPPAQLPASAASEPAVPDASPVISPPPTVLTTISQQAWAFGGLSNCSVASKRYELTIGAGQIHWRTGSNDTDDEAIQQDTTEEAHTTTIASRHPKSGKLEPIGTNWSYRFDSAGQLIVKRQGVVLGTLMQCQ